MVGKWHAGSVTFDQIPTGKGFNTYFGTYMEPMTTTQSIVEVAIKLQ